MQREPIATFLHPLERGRVDAAGEGCFTALHRESFDELLVDLRAQRVSAVVVSVSRYRAQHAPHMARLVREFPRIPAVALITANEPSTSQAVLALGQNGVRSLVDARDPKGWRELRQIVSSERSDAIERIALARVRADLGDVPIDVQRFFEAVFLGGSRVTTVRRLARNLGVVPSTFMSRFFRAKLPPPKRYLACARLVRAARLFENPGLSIAHVSNQLEYSSPQSFSRHVGTTLHMSALDFRRRFDGMGMLDHMRDELVLPYLDSWRTFEPMTSNPPWTVQRRPRTPE